MVTSSLLTIYALGASHHKLTKRSRIPRIATIRIMREATPQDEVNVYRWEVSEPPARFAPAKRRAERRVFPYDQAVSAGQ
jgi:hypothetical protein